MELHQENISANFLNHFYCYKYNLELFFSPRHLCVSSVRWPAMIGQMIIVINAS